MPFVEICRIIKKQELIDSVFDITVETKNIAGNALYGQFVHIKCGDDNLLRRPISICDIDGKNLRFIFAKKGRGTECLSKFEVGDELDILGPLGNGTFDLNINKDKKAVFVGGGIGIFPLLYPSKAIKDRSTVILGFQDESKVLMLDEFEKASSELIVTTNDGSCGEKGFVSSPLERLLKTGEYGCVYACGPTPMLKSVQKIAQQYNVKSQLSQEERMGCGIGACLVCACKIKNKEKENGFEYQHVCQNGPVFDGDEVIFDD